MLALGLPLFAGAGDQAGLQCPAVSSRLTPPWVAGTLSMKIKEHHPLAPCEGRVWFLWVVGLMVWLSTHKNIASLMQLKRDLYNIAQFINNVNSV